MPNINERPVCHRAEDMVTYLYGEASEADGRDFAAHLELCDACRVEFGAFRQVHNSILDWRNEALGSAFLSASVPAQAEVARAHFVQRERKLSALAALREFFTVSPLWLRVATGFAALLLCVLAGLTVFRSLKQTPTQGEFQAAVNQQVEQRLAQAKKQLAPETLDPNTTAQRDVVEPVDKQPNQTAVNQRQPKKIRPRGLSRQEREQLAKDLQLIPRDEDELPFALSEEPNQ